MLPYGLISLILALSPQPAAADNCLPRSAALPAATDTAYACELELKAAVCEEFFRSKPELKEHARACPSRTGAGRDILDLLEGCGVGGAEAAYEGVKTLVLLPYDIFLALKNSSGKSDQTLKACAGDMSCKTDLYRRAYGRDPGPAHRKKLEQKTSAASLLDLYHRATQADDWRRRAQGREWSKEIEELGKRYPMGSPEWTAGMRSIIPDYDKKVAHNKSSLWQWVENYWAGKEQALSCLDTEASAQLVCYSVFSLVDPAAKLALVARLPRLARLLDSLGERASLQAAVKAAKAKEALKEFERLQSLGRAGLKEVPAGEIKLLEQSANKNLRHSVSSEGKSIEMGEFRGEKVVLKVSGGAETLAHEARIYQVLEKSGIPTIYRGMARLPNGSTALVTKYTEGSLLKCVLGKCGLVHGGAPGKVTGETRKAILETSRRLDDLGIEAKDMQFLITKDGKAVLFDLGEFRVKGAPIPYLTRGELKAEVLRNRALNLSDEGIRVIHRETSNRAFAEALVQALH